jgi:hypothetical protein
MRQRRRQRRSWGRRALVLSLVLTARPALAQMGQGSARIPFTDWLIELYNVTNNVYVPLLALAALVGCVYLIYSGKGRMTENLGKVGVCVALLSLGITFVAQAAGGNVNVALLG